MGRDKTLAVGSVRLTNTALLFDMGAHAFALGANVHKDNHDPWTRLVYTAVVLDVFEIHTDAFRKVRILRSDGQVGWVWENWLREVGP